jgi:hypothetical protein
MTKGSDNPFPSALLEDQADAPSTPAAGHSRIFSKSDGLYIVDDEGNVTGPFAESVVAATFYGARYSSNAEQNIVNNTTVAIIDFEDVDYDPESLVTTGANWKFTAPETGYYHIDVLATLAVNTGIGGAERVILQLFRDGVQVLNLDRQDSETAGSSVQASVNGHATIHLNATQYIDVRIAQNSGGDIKLQADPNGVWINIEKVG